MNYKKFHTREILLFFLLSIALVFFFVLDLFSGSVSISLNEVFQYLTGSTANLSASKTLILSEYRIPKAITAILAGVALSVSGLQMQAVFRNPLAGPFVLGVSAGASLGVSILFMGFSIPFIQEIPALENLSTVLAASIGAAMVLLLILFISFRVKDIMTVLILGIMISSMINAVINILQYFSDASLVKSFFIWSMGSLSHISRDDLPVLSTVILITFGFSILLSKPLNGLMQGESFARTVGINVRNIHFYVFLSTSLLAGTITAFCGPIGFIGIVIPHIARFLFKNSDHRILYPASFLLGSITLLISDILSQLPGSDKVLPINSITALIGIPIIIWIVFSKQQLTRLN